MAKKRMEFKGLDEYIAMIQKMQGDCDGMIKKAVYEGAGVVAGAIREEIEALPETKETKTGLSLDPKKGISPTQKNGLLGGLGIAAIENHEGIIQTKIGFAGYNDVEGGGKWGGGQPNAMIARAIVSGTSKGWYKNNFVRTAIKKAKEKALNAMKMSIDTSIFALYSKHDGSLSNKQGGRLF